MEGFGVHTSVSSTRRQRAFRQVSLETSARRPLGRVDERRRFPEKTRTSTARFVGVNRERRLSRMGVCVQIVEEETNTSFDFDLLDATKIIPEELVPVRRIGKLTLDATPTNFFAETEQVAFNPGHLVSGIDLTNDRSCKAVCLLPDTQLIASADRTQRDSDQSSGRARAQQPARRPHAPDDIKAASAITRTHSAAAVRCRRRRAWAVRPHTERIEAHKIRARSESFFDHFSQAALFFNSQSEPEKDLSSRPCALSWAKWKCLRSESGWSACWHTFTRLWRAASRKVSESACPRSSTPL